MYEIPEFGVGTDGVVQRFVDEVGGGAARSCGVTCLLQGDDGLDETLLSAVVDIALQATARLVRGGHDPGP